MLVILLDKQVTSRRHTLPSYT